MPQFNYISTLRDNCDPPEGCLAEDCETHITCHDIIWPKRIGVEIHGTVSDPGGETLCPDKVWLFNSDIYHDVTYAYAAELTAWFGTPIEVEHVAGAPSDCGTWCLPPSPPWHFFDCDESQDGNYCNCPDIVGDCQTGLVELGANGYGYQLGATLGSATYDCAGSGAQCSQGGTITFSYTLSTAPHLMANLSLELSVGFPSGLIVTVSFATVLQQALDTHESVTCVGIPPSWSGYQQACNQCFSVVPLYGQFSRAFGGEATWETIKDTPIPGTIYSPRQTPTSCEFIQADRRVAKSKRDCRTEPTYSDTVVFFGPIGDLTLPRLRVTDAFCVLREI